MRFGETFRAAIMCVCGGRWGGAPLIPGHPNICSFDDFGHTHPSVMVEAGLSTSAPFAPRRGWISTRVGHPRWPPPLRILFSLALPTLLDRRQEIGGPPHRSKSDARLVVVARFTRSGRTAPPPPLENPGVPRTDICVEFARAQMRPPYREPRCVNFAPSLPT